MNMTLAGENLTEFMEKNGKNGKKLNRPKINKSHYNKN